MPSSPLIQVDELHTLLAAQPRRVVAVDCSFDLFNAAAGRGIRGRKAPPLQSVRLAQCTVSSRGRATTSASAASIKVFPVLHRCAELGRVHVHGGKLAFPDLPRF